jgi:hypothetical protein
VQICDQHRIREPFSALNDKDTLGAIKVGIVSTRVLLLIALLAPVVIIAAGIASRWRDPAGAVRAKSRTLWRRIQSGLGTKVPPRRSDVWDRGD